MAIRVVRLGTPRSPHEGLRIGTVRRPPRGVARRDYAKRDWYDVWLPELAPSPSLLKSFEGEGADAASWRRFSRSYLAEMRGSAARRLIDLLAVLSRRTNFSIGCYCAVEARCHRSILGGLLRERGASIAGHIVLHR